MDDEMIMRHNRVMYEIELKAQSSIDDSMEACIIRKLISEIQNGSCANSIRSYRYVHDFEYYIVPNQSHYGKGDLILTDGDGNYAICEAKYLNYASGNTSKSRNKKKRKYCREQVEKYLQQCDFNNAKGFAIWNNPNGTINVKQGGYIINGQYQWTLSSIRQQSRITTDSWDF